MGQVENVAQFYFWCNVLPPSFSEFHALSISDRATTVLGIAANDLRKVGSFINLPI